MAGQGTQALVAMSGICKSFNGFPVLRAVDLEIRTGEVHALVGENGAGKSTLMNILAAAIPRDAGSILLDGRPLQATSPAQAIAHGIAMMHQEPRLAAPLSVAENIFMGRLPRRPGGRVDAALLRRRTQDVLRAVSLTVDPATPVGRLSLAQRQLVQLAKAVALQARLVILDEPTASLTPVEVDALFALVGRLRQRGASFIYISHRLDEVFRLADRVTVLKDGAVVGCLPVGQTGKAALIGMMVGRTLETFYPPRGNPPEGEVVLQAEGLHGPGFAGVSLTLRRGEIVGLAGLVGAGRTELARALCGASPVTAGRLSVGGRAVRLRSPADGVRAGIAYLAEDRRDSVLRPLSVTKNISLAMRHEVARHGIVELGRERALAREFVARFNIRVRSLAQPAGGLSGGNQQKCVLARWVAKQTALLIVDEPTRGVDVGAKREIYDLLHRLAREGRAVLMISSELPEIIGMSDRILVMSEGRLAGALDGAAATEDAILNLAMPQANWSSAHV